MTIAMTRAITEKSSRRGFTLFEVLLSIALIAIIASFAVAVYQSSQVRSDLDIAVTTFVQSLRRAQLLAQAVERDGPWGVKADSTSTVVFQGTSYATRDTRFDETFPYPTSITFVSNPQVVFEKFTGTPTSPVTMTVTSSINESRTITVNAKGTVTY